MDKTEIICQINNIDIILETCHKTLSLLAENIDEDSSYILLGIMQHIESASKRIEKIQSVLYEKAVVA